MFAPAPYAAKTLVQKLVIKVVNNTIPNALTDISSEEGNPSLNDFLINSKSGFKSAILSLMPNFPVKSTASPMIADIACVIKVAIAAPCGPIAGIAPNPIINIGSMMKFKSAVPVMI